MPLEMPLEPGSVDRVMNALEMMMRRTSVSRSLDTIKRYAVEPEHIDDVILAAINASLCLVSDGDDQVADGFNDDLTRNGRSFGCRSAVAA
jgi:hypothetical protein